MRNPINLLSYQRLLYFKKHTAQCFSTQVAAAYNIIKPSTVTPTLEVPTHIQRPLPPKVVKRSFFDMFKSKQEGIEIKSDKQIEGMKNSCKLAREVLDIAGEQVKEGTTTDEIDKIVHRACIQRNAYPSPLLYKGFPKSVCTSVNNVACHGIPDERCLEDGDIINIDVTVFYNGYHGDLSQTYCVGDPDEGTEHLLGSTKLCLETAIEICGPGVPLADIGTVISYLSNKLNLQVIPDFCGHGIGSYFHGPPDIFHFANDDKTLMQEGMTFTIEPILTEGEPAIRVLDDGWTAVTIDNSRSAQFEHTILITQNGAQILTL